MGSVGFELVRGVYAHQTDLDDEQSGEKKEAAARSRCKMEEYMLLMVNELLFVEWNE